MPSMLITATGFDVLLTVIVTVAGALAPFESVTTSVTTYIPGTLKVKAGLAPVRVWFAPLYMKDQEYAVMDPDGKDFEPSKVTVVPSVTVWSEPALATGAPETKLIVVVEEVGGASVIGVP